MGTAVSVMVPHTQVSAELNRIVSPPKPCSGARKRIGSRAWSVATVEGWLRDLVQIEVPHPSRVVVSG
jgi:hypothetical protein